LGSALYGVGGFSLPFLGVASVALINAIALAVVVPKMQVTKREGGQETPQLKLTFSTLIKVNLLFHLLLLWLALIVGPWPFTF
jgi:hypothetical protein